MDDSRLYCSDRRSHSRFSEPKSEVPILENPPMILKAPEMMLAGFVRSMDSRPPNTPSSPSIAPLVDSGMLTPMDSRLSVTLRAASIYPPISLRAAFLASLASESALWRFSAAALRSSSEPSRTALLYASCVSLSAMIVSFSLAKGRRSFTSFLIRSRASAKSFIWLGSRWALA